MQIKRLPDFPNFPVPRTRPRAVSYGQQRAASPSVDVGRLHNIRLYLSEIIRKIGIDSLTPYKYWRLRIPNLFLFLL